MCANYTSLATRQSFHLGHDVSSIYEIFLKVTATRTVDAEPFCSDAVFPKVVPERKFKCYVTYITRCLCRITDTSNGPSGPCTDLYRIAVTHIITFPNTCIWIQLVSQ